MTGTVTKGDVIVLVADKNMESAVQGILSRSRLSSNTSVKAEIHVHIERDPGCTTRAMSFFNLSLSSFLCHDPL